MQGLTLELARGGIGLVVTLIGLGIGWLIGQRFTYQWNMRQKRRELDLAATQDFQRLYGELFAVWKLWNEIVRSQSNGNATIRHDLLRRATDAEGLVERLLLKLVTERHLSAGDRDVLGAFRQGYKQLRYAVMEERPLTWNNSDNPEYLAFKLIGVSVVAILHREPSIEQVGSREAFEALRDITSNCHEQSWTNQKTT